VATDELQVAAAHGVKVVADTLIYDCIDKTYDLIALPGGMPGAEHLRDSEELIRLLKIQVQEGRLYAAICASPAVVFQHHGLIDTKKVTCYPSFLGQLVDAESSDSDVVVDGNCITSKGPGTALKFSLKLVEALYGKSKADELSNEMIVS